MGKFLSRPSAPPPSKDLEPRSLDVSAPEISNGISGTTTAAHLLRASTPQNPITVTVFERASVAGGVWHLDPRPALLPSIPNVRPPSPRDSLLHAPPGPAYQGLKNNVPTSLMRSMLLDWPEGTEEIVPRARLCTYIQDLAVRFGSHAHTLYNTSLISISKSESNKFWGVRSRTLSKMEGRGETRFEEKDWMFDAVVVAAGHYHEPRIPDIQGLKEVAQRLDGAVLHSKQYRNPSPFAGKNILVVGGGVSSLDIVKEVAEVVGKGRVWQSTRGGQWDLPAVLLPVGVERVGEIERFIGPEGQQKPFGVVLKDGHQLDGIDHIIFGTGYITSYPFLGKLQNPDIGVEDADEKIVITSDGCTTHNLHHDIFYIPDPTLAFVGVPYYVSTFSLFDLQGDVVARVFSGKASLPPRDILEKMHRERKEEKAGWGRAFHNLYGRDVEYMEGMTKWVNQEARRRGVDEMRGLLDDEKWRERKVEGRG
ncbi:putative FAD dependent oxidoreductase [Bisporella sp. PMI_857]|nr:putative FAD dependent oxidoreductase [Bisporella sp. PMI_857]